MRGIVYARSNRIALPFCLVLREYFSASGQYPSDHVAINQNLPLRVISQHSDIDEAAEIQLLRPEMRHDGLTITQRSCNLLGSCIF